ncbi:unnamed protein product [Chrysodeixis includens]|uniref:CBF1-interacting co-repressor CIR N-terminal domain-containing protein n=1 Tax=Chrysodeixis includens TaxID=689277 RepID=A0A9N8PYI5_CHRIL|nr:unnamed protein product [Chrysodeixis includens]
MNILPKKRWHVRTKENIARVRKDEAEAAEKEKQEKLRIERADREARLSVLKHKSKLKLQEYGIEDKDPGPKQDEVLEHVNLFRNFEEAIKTTNKEHDNEAKNKKEEYEKKIGYLTYLGQDTNEALGKTNWYEVPPEASGSSRSSNVKETYDKLVLKDEDGKPKIREVDEKNGEVGWKKKQSIDPMNAFKHLHHSSKALPTKIKEKKSSNLTNKNDQYKHKKKKHKIDKREEKEKKLQKLREARLKREQQEKYRTELFLTGLNKTPDDTDREEKDNKVKAKYNSQFNPELARQNYR